MPVEPVLLAQAILGIPDPPSVEKGIDDALRRMHPLFTINHRFKPTEGQREDPVAGTEAGSRGSLRRNDG
jgi:hypothetical protein